MPERIKADDILLDTTTFPNIDRALKLLDQSHLISHVVWVLSTESPRYELYIASTLHRLGPSEAPRRVRTSLRATGVKLPGGLRVVPYNDPTLTTIANMFGGRVAISGGGSMRVGDLDVRDAKTVRPRPDNTGSTT